jgi:hypothetical protein
MNIHKKVYHFDFHNSEDIFYTISFTYNKRKIFYTFNREKYLIIWEKKYIDSYNFDEILSKIINEKENFSNYYNFKNEYSSD